MVETTALGAAILAGIGAGLIDINEVDASQVTKFSPKIGEDGKYIFHYIISVIIWKEKKYLRIMYKLFIFILEKDLRYSKWKMAVERSMKWDCSTTPIDN